MNRGESKELGNTILFVAILFIFFGSEMSLIPFAIVFLCLFGCFLPDKK